MRRVAPGATSSQRCARWPLMHVRAGVPARELPTDASRRWQPMGAAFDEALDDGLRELDLSDDAGGLGIAAQTQLRGARAPAAGLGCGHEPDRHPRPCRGRSTPRLRFAQRGAGPAPAAAARVPRSWTSAAAAATRACRWRRRCRWVASASSTSTAKKARFLAVAGPAVRSSSPMRAGRVGTRWSACASRPSRARRGPRRRGRASALPGTSSRRERWVRWRRSWSWACPLAREGGLVVAWKREDERGGPVHGAARGRLDHPCLRGRATGRRGRPVPTSLPGHRLVIVPKLRADARDLSRGRWPRARRRDLRAPVAARPAGRALLGSRPMRVAVLSDIHSNAPALEAVLGVGRRRRPGLGARRHRRLRRPAGRGGGAPRAPLGRSPCRATTTPPCWDASPTDTFNDLARDAVSWTASAIAPGTRAWLAACPSGGRRTTFTLVHGSPRDPLWEYLVSVPDGARRAGRRSRPAYCLVGHTHVPACLPGRGRAHRAAAGRGRRPAAPRRAALHPQPGQRGTASRRRPARLRHARRHGHRRGGVAPRRPTRSRQPRPPSGSRRCQASWPTGWPWAGEARAPALPYAVPRGAGRPSRRRPTAVSCPLPVALPRCDRRQRP